MHSDPDGRRGARARSRRGCDIVTRRHARGHPPPRRRHDAPGHSPFHHRTYPDARHHRTYPDARHHRTYPDARHHRTYPDAHHHRTYPDAHHHRAHADAHRRWLALWPHERWIGVPRQSQLRGQRHRCDLCEQLHGYERRSHVPAGGRAWKPTGDRGAEAPAQVCGDSSCVTCRGGEPKVCPCRPADGGGARIAVHGRAAASAGGAGTRAARGRRAPSSHDRYGRRGGSGNRRGFAPGGRAAPHHQPSPFPLEGGAGARGPPTVEPCSSLRHSPAPATLERITLSFGAARVIRKRVRAHGGTRMTKPHVYLINNPARCTRSWVSSVLLTSGMAPLHRSLLGRPA